MLAKMRPRHSTGNQYVAYRTRPAKKAGFGQSQREPHHIEGQRRHHECGRDRNQPPYDHDSGNPPFRADAVKDQIAWNIKEKISDKEDARSEAIDRLAEVQFRQHL
jgi:hypothetical protein